MGGVGLVGHFRKPPSSGSRKKYKDAAPLLSFSHILRFFIKMLATLASPFFREKKFYIFLSAPPALRELTAREKLGALKN